MPNRLPLALALLVTGHAAVAQVAPDAARVLAQARAASGDWSHVAILRARGTVATSGLEGTYALDQDARDGRSDEREVFPLFANRDVWDGRNAWHQDNSDGVHPHDGAYSKRRSADDAWLARRGWLRDEALGAWVGPVARVEGLDTVTVVPRGGEAMDLSFDPGSHDLVKVFRRTATASETTTYGDFRVVDGLRLPFSVDVESDGSPVSARFTRYERTARVPADIFVRPRAPDDTRIGAAPVTIPLDVRNGELTIEARINGQGPFRFIFDTGGHSILSPDAAKALGLEAGGNGQSGGAGEGTLVEQYAQVKRVDLGGTDSRGVEAGGVTLTDQHFYVLDLGYPTWERGNEAPLAGLLGLEVAERLGVRIDYPHERMTFASFDRHRFEPGATVVPLTFDDDIPLVEATLDGNPGIFALDTGNSGSTDVQRVWAERVGLAERMKAGLETASYGAGGVSRNWASRLGRLEVGGATIDRQFGRYSEDRRGAFASRTEAGNIGSDVLRNFVVDFDYRRGQMAWRHVDGFVQPPFSRAGLRALKQRPEDFTVLAVTAGSPAAESGVREKDRIVAVNGKSTTQLSGDDMADAFRQAVGTPVRLSLVRGDERIETTIVLRELLPM